MPLDQNLQSFHDRLLSELDVAPGNQLYLGEAEVVAIKASEDSEEDFYYVLYFSKATITYKVCAECKGFRHRSFCSHLDRAQF